MNRALAWGILGALCAGAALGLSWLGLPQRYGIVQAYAPAPAPGTDTAAWDAVWGALLAQQVREAGDAELRRTRDGLRARVSGETAWGCRARARAFRERLEASQARLRRDWEEARREILSRRQGFWERRRPLEESRLQEARSALPVRFPAPTGAAGREAWTPELNRLLDGLIQASFRSEATAAELDWLAWVGAEAAALPPEDPARRALNALTWRLWGERLRDFLDLLGLRAAVARRIRPGEGKLLEAVLGFSRATGMAEALSHYRRIPRPWRLETQSAPQGEPRLPLGVRLWALAMGLLGLLCAGWGAALRRRAARPSAWPDPVRPFPALSFGRPRPLPLREPFSDN